MKNGLAFVVPGPPQPWERVTPRSGGHSFVPKATREYEARVHSFAWAAMRNGAVEPFTGPTFLVARFYIPRTKETRRKVKTAGGATITVGVRKRTADPSYIWPIRNEDGDTDNMVKALKDGLAGPKQARGAKVLANDKLVVAVAAWKLWAPQADPAGYTEVLLFRDMEAWAQAAYALAFRTGRK